MIKLSEITSYLHQLYPPSYQESYDNSGLLTGNPEMDIESALITLDVTEEVIDEAINLNCNLIIAHHPLIFKPLKKLTGSNMIERCLLKAIKNDIAILAVHTNLDKVNYGVNKKIADKLQLTGTKILAPQEKNLSKLTVFVPSENVKELTEAIHQAGAGQIGNYEHCSFQINGKGYFRPNEEANPHIGETGKLESVDETRVEVVFPSFKSKAVLQAMLKAHPYEEVAHFLHQLSNVDQTSGLGMIGDLQEPMEPSQFLEFVKESLELSFIRYTYFERKIQRVAVCGGSGSSLLNMALSKNADAFVTSDFKYHEFFEAEKNLMIADINHFEGERFTKDLIYENLRKKFPNFATHLSEINTNPVKYYH